MQSGPTIVRLRRHPITPRATKALQCAIDEARNLKDDYVGTEHILLGLLHEDEGFASQVLMNLSLRLDQVRAVILAMPVRVEDDGGR